MGSRPQHESILIGCQSPETIDELNGILVEFKTTVMVDGAKVVEQAHENPPDLVLLDAPLTGMGAFIVCQMLKEHDRTRDVPIIVMTDQDDNARKIKSLDLGAADTIPKPLQPVVVKRRVETHLNLRLANERLQNQDFVLNDGDAELQESLRNLKSASLETIRRLSRAAEYKDDDTGGHIIRMSHYSAAIAQQMGLDHDQTDMILHASPMHDIGKIGVPDSILLKPGKLNPKEWILMKSHSDIGGKILAGSSQAVINCGETIARFHHESWDGMGYPSGLKGEGIPLVARIVAIADVFDALTTCRPYRQPLSLDESLQILQQERELHLDPAVVDAFFEIADELLMIKKMFADEEMVTLSFTTD